MFEGRWEPLIKKNYSFAYTWTKIDVKDALYTESDLRRIDRNFWHPSMTAPVNLLKRASGGSIPIRTKMAIISISKECATCKTNETAPIRFRLSTRADDLRFNHSPQIDTMFIGGREVAHMVNETTQHTHPSFLLYQSRPEIWNVIR